MQRTLYQGQTQRVSREFRQNGTLTDVDALAATIKKAADGSTMTTVAEGEFSSLDIVANKVSDGVFFAEITPTTANGTGVYLLYWEATYGTGDSAENFVEGPDVLVVEAAAPAQTYASNYLSLDAIVRHYKELFELISPAQMLSIGDSGSRDIDGRLDSRFAVPISKKEDGTYDQALIDAAAYFVIERVLRDKGYTDEADGWEERYFNQLEGINSGRFRLDEEITKDEIGFGKPKPYASNTSANMELELDPDCSYTGDHKRRLIIKVDTAGDVGTATVKVSTDAGNSWAATEQLTDEDEGYIYPIDCYGLGFRFYRLGTSANLALNDYWTVDAIPEGTDETPTEGAIRTGELLL